MIDHDQIERGKIEAYRRLYPKYYARTALQWNLDDWQKDFMASKQDRIILNCSRQAGKSTTGAVKLSHMARYTDLLVDLGDEMHTIAIIAPTQRQSINFLRRAKVFLRRSNPSINITGWSTTRVEIDHKYEIVALPENPEGVRGYSICLLIVDEAAFVSDEMYAAVSPMLAVSGGAMWLLSTAFMTRGYFYDVWQLNDPRWARFEVPWHLCPRISEDFIQFEAKLLPENIFNMEYLCRFEDPVDAVFSTSQINAAFTSSPGIELLDMSHIATRHDPTAIQILNR